MKIETYFLLRSREVKRKKFGTSKIDVTYNKGIYLMDRKAINFYGKENKKPKGVEMFFYEGNTAPIQIDKQGEDTSLKFLDDYIYENVIEQTGAIPKERLKGAFNWARNNLTIGNVIKWGLMLMILSAAVGGWLGIW